MDFPLNINLIIPFKDNKGIRLKQYQREIESFKTELDDRVSDLKEEISCLFENKFELAISSRSDGNSKKYYWRFTTSKRDRKYNRLHVESVIDYIKQFDNRRYLRLKEIEQELIYINANLKLIKGILDSISQCQNENEDLANMV